MAKVVIVVPVFNGEAYIRRCIEQALDNTSVDCRLIAVDNASVDRSASITTELVKERAGRVFLQRNDRNVGFPAACNQGIKWGFEQGADFLVLLNQDAFACKKWLEELVDTAQREAQIGAVQALVLLDGAGGLAINTAGNPIHFLGYSWCGSYGQTPPSGPAEAATQVPIGSGAALLLTRPALEACGLLEESFFLYHEDTDLCWRIRLAGFRIEVATDARVVHRYSQGAGLTKFCFAERNRWMLLLRTASWRRLLISAPLLAVSAAAAMIVAAKNGWIVAFVRSQMYIVWHLGQIAAARRRIQKTRRLRERDLAAWLCAEIDAQGILPAGLQSAANGFLRGYWSVARRLL